GFSWLDFGIWINGLAVGWTGIGFSVLVQPHAICHQYGLDYISADPDRRQRAAYRRGQYQSGDDHSDGRACASIGHHSYFFHRLVTRQEGSGNSSACFIDIALARLAGGGQQRSPFTGGKPIHLWLGHSGYIYAVYRPCGDIRLLCGPSETKPWRRAKDLVAPDYP